MRRLCWFYVAVAMLWGCDPEQETGGASGLETGELIAQLRAPDDEVDVAAVELRVHRRNGQGRDTLEATALIGANEGESEALFVLKPATYRVEATPLGEDGEPSVDCAVAEAETEILANATRRLPITILCEAGRTGGLVVEVGVELAPGITGSNRMGAEQPEACQAIQLGVRAIGEDLAHAWSVVGNPAEAHLVPTGPTSRFFATAPGLYEVAVEVSNASGTASLSFPITVGEGPDDCLEADEDGDGVADLLDVCPTVADPGQEVRAGEALGEACTDPGGPFELRFEVEAELDPARNLAVDPEIPGDRPVALMAVGEEAFELVADELVLTTSDAEALAAFLEETEAEVLSTMALEEGTSVLLRMPALALDAAELAAAARRENPFARGVVRASSAEALGLLAYAARAKARGLSATANILLEGQTIATRSTAEAPAGPNGYGPDAFNWSYTRMGGNQDMGVAEAWRMLEATGRDRNRVRAAIFDGGFVNQDLPGSTRTFGGGFGVQNPASCTGGNPCPWHGSMVAGTMAAVPDNSFGVAGSGGTVVDPLLVQTPNLTFWGIARYIVQTLPRVAQAQPFIVNISAGGQLPAVPCFFLCGGVDLITMAIRRAGILVYASAGNENRDLDKLDCLFAGGPCWEEGAYLPCEAADVECVGALAWDSTGRANFSNFGSSTNRGNSVDIYGPGETYVSDPNAGAGGPGVQRVGGTSMSSPFVAGCAAMVKAANPRLSPSQVAAVIRNSAHTGSADPRVNRWLDCHEAVRRQLGGAPPFVQITAPAANTIFRRGIDTIELRADADDHEDTVPNLRWVSDRDGQIGTLVVIRPNLSLGRHVIRVIATDSNGWRVSDTVELEVVDAPLVATFTTPRDGSGHFIGNLLPIRVEAFDYALASRQVPANAIEVRLDGNLLGTGPAHTILANGLPLGQHVLEAEVNAGGRQITARSTFDVVNSPPQLPPQVWMEPLEVPEHVANILEDARAYAEVRMFGGAIDAEDGPIPGPDMEWLDAAGEVLATGQDATLFLEGGDVPVDHDITLRATNAAGVQAEVTTRVRVVPEAGL